MYSLVNSGALSSNYQYQNKIIIPSQIMDACNRLSEYIIIVDTMLLLVTNDLIAIPYNSLYRGHPFIVDKIHASKVSTIEDCT